MSQLIVRIDEADSACLACNWNEETLYVTAPTEDIGLQFYQQNGGLCANCLLNELFLQEKAILEVHDRNSLIESEA